MIDIHAHILPGVDDGPRDWQESLAILQRGRADGIRGVVCTSHVLDRLDAEVERTLIQKFKALEKIVQENGLDIRLWLGSEIHSQTKFDLTSKVATVNGNGKYLLFELPLGELPQDVGDILFHISMEGVTPILAHPERNVVIIRRPETAFDFVRRGVLLQLNAGSITGDFGKKVKGIATLLLDHRCVHFVASDCHSVRNRPMVLSKAYHVVERRWGRETAERLFRSNPYKAVMGEEIVSQTPVVYAERKSRAGRIFGARLIKNRSHADG